MPTKRSYPRIRITSPRSGAYVAHVALSETTIIDLPGEHPTFDAALRVAGDRLGQELAARQELTASPTVEAAPTVEVAVPPAARPKPVPTRCPGCLRRVRKAAQKAAEWPGTVPMMDRHGHCSRCKRRQQLDTIKAADAADAAAPPAKPAKPRPAPATMTCTEPDCTTDINRNSRTGLCRTHYQAARAGTSSTALATRALTQQLPDADTLPLDARHAKQGLESYFAARRRRGIPPEGTTP